jgi:hypothetical protein
LGEIIADAVYREILPRKSFLDQGKVRLDFRVKNNPLLSDWFTGNGRDFEG